MNERKKGSGGARPGAGRPRKMSRNAIALERALTGSGTCVLGWRDDEAVTRVMTLPEGVSPLDYVNSVIERNQQNMRRITDEDGAMAIIGLMISLPGPVEVATYLRVSVSKLMEYVEGIDSPEDDIFASTVGLLRITQKSNDQKTKNAASSS